MSIGAGETRARSAASVGGAGHADARAQLEAALAPCFARRDRPGARCEVDDLFGTQLQMVGAGIAAAGRPRLSLRLMLSLLYLKHAYDQSDEALVGALVGERGRNCPGSIDKPARDPHVAAIVPESGKAPVAAFESDNTARAMPDVARDAHPDAAGPLDWVGMGAIEAPVSLADEDGRLAMQAAHVDAFVNLKRADARGIHMSRLYRHVDRALTVEPLTPCGLRRLLKDFLDSHAELSDRARLKIRFDHLLRRNALASEHSGWRRYPVIIEASMVRDAHGRDRFDLELGFEVLYSSTCPCSAALARQLIQERFREDFAADGPLDREAVLAWLGSEHGICATPHSQRSRAEVRVRLVPSFRDFPILALIDAVEGALKTPVQTAVKREDEQAFARLNGENLMFCEDAARRIRAALDADEHVVDFHVRASHFESLHPHDAVAEATRGVPGGYAA